MADGQPQGRIPPHDLVVERALLGCCLLDAACVEAVSAALEPKHFYKDAHALIFEAIQAIARGGNAPDTTLLRSQLLGTNKLARAGGDEYLYTLTDTIPTVALVEGYARRIREFADVRKLIHACHEVAAEGYGAIEDVPDWFERAERKITSATLRKGVGLAMKPFSEALSKSYTELAERVSSGQKIEGYLCGLYVLDDFMSGWVPGELTIVAGRPGMGKSAFANRVRIGIAKSTGKPVLSFELEMSGEQNARRAMAAEAGVNLRRVRSATFQDGELSKLAVAANDLSRLPLYFSDECPMTITQLRRAVKQARRELREDISLVCVDYLQLLQGSGRSGNRDGEIGELTRGLKMLAKEEQVPVLVLSQLNRELEKRPNKRPLMSDLRESGNIEQDADNILFLYRDEVYHRDSPDKGICEVIVGKQRQGANATLKFLWRKEFTRFENLEAFRQEPIF